MRIYRKAKEDGYKVWYKYLWSDYTKPYTGLIEINKKEMTYKVLKLADGDYSEEKAGYYALSALSRNGYPRSYTHTAS